MSKHTLVHTDDHHSSVNDRVAQFSSPVVHLTDQFSMKQLLIFWDALMNDPGRAGTYMDTMPTHLDQFMAPVSKDEMYFWLILCDGEVAGAGWLHDVKPYKNMRSAWFALYHAPEYRSVMGAQTQHALWKKAKDMGIPAIFSGTRSNNHRTRRFAERGGLHQVAIIEQFGWFEGYLDDVCIYTLHLEDREEALRQAEIRAMYNRANPPVLAA